MFILADLKIPKAQLNELKSLSESSIRSLLIELIDYVTSKYTEEFDNCNNISRGFHDWINTLTKSQVITLSCYVLSILDYLIKD